MEEEKTVMVEFATVIAKFLKRREMGKVLEITLPGTQEEILLI